MLPAWEKTAGRSDVIVAVVDEGVEYTHPDLAGNMWSGIGKNFCDRDNDDITWGEGHGTHVAGTIAAVSNNGIGISGIAGGTGGGNGAKIMSCEIFHPTDGHYDANSNATADAIKYAADNGAVICQNSWGYAAGALSYDQWSSADRATKEAIDYFIRYAGMSPDGETQTGPMAGGVVIFAAGNEYSRLASYPAAYDACISVASISCTYEAAWYTNYGSTVDICAPGGGDEANFVNLISYDEGYNLSTIPTNLQNGDSFVYTYANGETETKTIDYVSSTVGYGYMMGTSMACPHVSGVAALIVSQFGAPGFTNEQLKEKLFSTARDIDSYQGTIYNSWDRGTYAGKIGKLVDAGAVLDSGEVPPVSDQPTITPAVGQSDTFSLAENAVKTLTYTLAHYTDWSLNDPTGKIAQSIDGNVVTLTIDASQYAAGSYTAELLAVNGTKTAKRTIAYTVSEGDNPTGISMDFYPNPCTDVLNILPNYSGESTIRIRNSMGTEVMNITLGLINEEPVKLDVSGLASGTYLVQVTYNGIQITRTIVKR
ncbi:S8/S53 family peptidase [Alistipes putredinis]|uniref:S8/S53 family peptidase n=1 Tax=Alistipes putredinis TaxID=28117 RepID=UPI003AB5F505